MTLICLIVNGSIFIPLSFKQFHQGKLENLGKTSKLAKQFFISSYQPIYAMLKLMIS